MPAEHLRALVERCAGGRSVREMETAVGLPGRLAHYLKPGTTLNRMLNLAQLRDIAKILGCGTDEVYAAVLRDLDPGGELVGGLSPEEQAVLALFRQLDEHGRRRLRRIAEVLHTE